MPLAQNQFSVGLDVCIDEPHQILRNARFGLLMNHASVDRRLRFACDALAESYPSQLVKLFSPQHGFWGEQQANMIESPHAQHPTLQIPIYSLYSETRCPTAEMLSDLDCLVIDLQDVGTRVYTFIWTVTYCLEACADAGIPVVILDRPNPIGGMAVEGPVLENEFRSFVGRAAIPMRHGLTIAELAVFLRDEMQLNTEIHVVPMRGWTRDVLFEETGRVWLPPSPNLPTLSSVQVYPGQVLLEGTNISEGRGTTRPFEIVGAPYIEPMQLASALVECQLPGVVFHPLRFVPTFDKWSGTSCGGVALHVVDTGQFRPYRTTIHILAAVKRLWPREFEWIQPPYEYESHMMPIDILSGSAELRQELDSACSLSPSSVDRLSCSNLEWKEKALRSRIYPPKES